MSKSKRSNRTKNYIKVLPIQAPIKTRQLLCGMHKPAPDYIDKTPTCAGCDYWAGTKCEDIHTALIASERNHDAYSYMVCSNRGVYL